METVAGRCAAGEGPEARAVLRGAVGEGCAGVAKKHPEQESQ